MTEREKARTGLWAIGLAGAVLFSEGLVCYYHASGLSTELIKLRANESLAGTTADQWVEIEGCVWRRVSVVRPSMRAWSSPYSRDDYWVCGGADGVTWLSDDNSSSGPLQEEGVRRGMMSMANDQLVAQIEGALLSKLTEPIFVIHVYTTPETEPSRALKVLMVGLVCVGIAALGFRLSWRA